MSTTRTHPRRTQHVVDSSKALPRLDPKAHLQSLPLRKGSTFHSSKTPSSEDPVLNVRGVPIRSPTSPKALEDLVAASESRISTLLENIDRSLASKGSSTLDPNEAFPVPSFMLAHTSSGPVTGAKSKSSRKTHNHESDSGLGSSVASNSDDEREVAVKRNGPLSVRSHSSVYSATRVAALDSSVASADIGDDRPFLSRFAAEKINEHIVNPLLAEDKLKDYHKLVGEIPARISGKKITCLRDLEKTLVFLAPSRAKSAASYLQFCETSIQCIHTTVEHINDVDKQRPSDRPYSNNYFLDLISQVRQYARIMASSRAKQAEGKPLDKADYTSEEKLVLEGGEGGPAYLAREKNGEKIPIDTEKLPVAESDEDEDDDPERSMARKRKCDIGKEVWRACRECGKEFKRPCDLTKHEKTHSRPWKCPVENCKYHSLGWPTEKECDRHFNDKHTSTPSLYQCLYEGCTYTSKRESNCKQHMEKTHGYEYVRSKSKKTARLVPSAGGQADDMASAMLTPNSALNSISTPGSDFRSPQLMGTNELSPPATDEAASPFNSGKQTMSLFGNSTDLFGQGNMFTGSTFADSRNMTPNSSSNQGEAITTPALTFSEIDPSIPDDAWTDNFEYNDFANMDDDFPSPQEFFDMYYSVQQDPVQQPTPAVSDFDISKDLEQQFGNPVGKASGPMTVAAQQQNPMLNPSSSAMSGASFTGNDFPLFGDSAENSGMGNAFPELSGNGGQFAGMTDQHLDLDHDFPMYRNM